MKPTKIIKSSHVWAKRIGRVLKSLPGIISAVSAATVVIMPAVLRLVYDVGAATGTDPAWIENGVSRVAATIAVVLAAASIAYKRLEPVTRALIGWGDDQAASSPP